MFDFNEQYEIYRTAVEDYLDGLFREERPYGKLQEAMRYSLLAGGKRVRPVLTLAFCDMLGGNWRDALPVACALELIHTYSLIHDDLPCMDDDDLRRGKPTCHKVYGETIAVLAGDALQPEAFGLIANAESLTAQQRVEAVAALAAASGGDGMVAGQVLDLDGSCRSEREVNLLHRLKTGKLLSVATELGCIAANADGAIREKAVKYGEHIGLAFQVRDDMLDVIGNEDEFGKPIGSDQEEGKVTYVDLLGLDGCRTLVEQETALALSMIDGLDGNEFLRCFAQQLAERRK